MVNTEDRRPVIGVVGLGLIGGSLALAFRREGSYRVIGEDIDQSVEQYAILSHAIDGTLREEGMGHLSYLFLALRPGALCAWMREHAAEVAKETVVIDCAGVKRCVYDECMKIASAYGFRYIGGHPMAGREYSGIRYATSELFRDAYMILTPRAGEDIALLDRVRVLLSSIGFAGVTVTTPEEHDRVIAYTSQLAHVVSSAYIKSPRSAVHKGFSAGSYRDLTRVARMNADMWTELFLDNADFLTEELDGLISALSAYRDAISAGDASTLHDMLADGDRRKKEIDGQGASEES